ncbi:MAG: ArsI/CadI family heavy metal resistance metalloenzyme [Myxococcota bacterium]
MTTRVHISVTVADLATAVHFYEALFGQDVSRRRPDYANFRLDQPPLMLALVSQPGRANPGGEADRDACRHYGVELPSADILATWRDRARTAGLALRLETDKVCCYAKADKFWVDDPDGNAWEFWYRKGDADTMH